MPPKNKAQKQAEDKTFGLKNKNKSKKVQAFVQTIQNSAKFAGKSHKQVKEEEAAKAARSAFKQAKAMEEMEQQKLFGFVVNKTHVPFGVDPKTVVCEFFKAGKCVRGNKCKFSHNLELERKTSKIDLYTDPRSMQGGEGGADTGMEGWSTEDLAEVVKLKSAGRLPPTNIICKYFLDAIENRQYGWRWVS
jgi:hypothetical protein